MSMSSVNGNMDVPSRKNRGEKKRKDGRKNKQTKNTETFLISLTATVLGGWQWVL